VYIVHNIPITVCITVIILVAIIGVSSLVCVIIVCVGVTWLCRYDSIYIVVNWLHENYSALHKR